MHSVASGHSICELLHTLEQGMLPLSVFMPHAPIPRHRARDAARREMSEFLNPIMAERRKKLASGEKIKAEDLLWKLMTATYPDGRATKETCFWGEDQSRGLIVEAYDSHIPRRARDERNLLLGRRSKQRTYCGSL